MKASGFFVGLICLVVSWPPASARADGKSQLAKDAAEFVFQRFGKQAVREGVATLAGRIESLAVRHGNEVFQAVRKVGPRTFHLVEQAGAHGKDAVRLLALHGEQAALVLGKANGLALCLKHGDKVVSALVKHPGIAEPVIEKFGATAIRTLEAVGPQGGRRLAMLVEGGELAKIGRSQEVLELIGKFGDRAMTFVWQHKGALATTAGLTAFLANPEAFINGAKDMAQIVGENAIKPVMQIPGAVAAEVARGTNWTVILLAFGGAGLAWVGVRYFGLGKRLQETLASRKTASPSAGAATGDIAKDRFAAVNHRISKGDHKCL